MKQHRQRPTRRVTTEGRPGDAVGLWVMSGFIGLVAAATILVINRRPPYAPWVALGLLPMAISAYWVLT